MNIVILRIKTRNVDYFLSKLYKLNIDIYNVIVNSYNEIIIEINYEDLSKLKFLSLLNKVEIVDYKGNIKRKNNLLFNKTLIIFIVFGIILLYILSNIIFTIDIEHSNSKIKDLVMSELSSYGVKKYSFRKSFNELNEIKNKILNNNKDKIEWLEITRVGTKYIVKLEDRNIFNNNVDYNYQDIVSTHDAVIKKIIAKSGVKVKEVNEYVKKGDTIISGTIYLNDEIKDYVKSIGEVYGEVWYKLSIEYPIINDKDDLTGKSMNVYSINLFSNKYYLFNKNKYKNYKVKSIYLLKNNILPISISYDKIYELTNNSYIITIDEALSSAKNYAYNKVKETLSESEYIISDNLLNYQVNSNTIYMSVFYRVYKNITGVKEIVIE